MSRTIAQITRRTLLAPIVSPAQSHATKGDKLDGNTVADIARSEQRLTGADGPIPGGPTVKAQSLASGGYKSQQEEHSGSLDAATISKITAAEKAITGDDTPAKGGPTAQAQKHAGEHINSQNLHDITEGEKTITGGERIKGGPTSTAQSELSKSRS